MRRIAIAIAALLLAAGSSPVMAGGGVPKLANVDAGPHTAEIFNDSPSVLTGANTVTVKIRELSADHTVQLELIGPNGEHVQVRIARVILLDPLDDDEHSHAEDVDDDGAKSDGHAAKSGDHAAKPDDHNTVARDTHGVINSHGEPVAPVQAKVAPVADAHGGRPASVNLHSAGVKGDHGSATSVASAAAAHDEAQADDGHGDKTEAYVARGSVSVPSTGLWTARLSIRDEHGEEMVGETQVQVSEGGPNRLYLGFTGGLIFGSMLFGLIQRRRPSWPLSTTKDRN